MLLIINYIYVNVKNIYCTFIFPNMILDFHSNNYCIIFVKF